MQYRRLLIVLMLVPLFSFSISGVAQGARPVTVVVPQGWPKTVSLPRIGVNAPVEALSFTKAADYRAPYRFGDVAWYDRGARPGDAGRAMVVGHLDSYCCPAIFYRLRYVKKGDVVTVGYRTGTPLTFKVQWVASYPNNKIPLKYIFAPTTEHGIVLMTCTGDFHRDGTGYDHKLIVYARLLLPNGKIA